jgi:hypothetical protein
MTDDNHTGIDAGTTDDGRTDRQQTLDTAMDRATHRKLGGRLDQKLADAFEHREEEVDKSVDRFNAAINEGWEMHYAVATSGAHGWQIESDDDGLRLADGAYCGDVSWLVFENGWIHATGGQWLRDRDLATWVAGIQARRESAAERMNDAEREAFEADDRLRHDTDLGGNEMKGWWVFEPTGFVGRPEAVVAHADGYDAHRDEGGEGR